MKLIPATSASLFALIVATGIATPQQLSFDINRISDSGVDEKIGTATATEAKKGGVTFRMAVNGFPKASGVCTFMRRVTADPP